MKFLMFLTLLLSSAHSEPTKKRNPASNEPNEVASFKLGTRGANVFSSNHLVVHAIPDPDVRGATCFVSTVQARGFTLSSDPSDMSIACRQTGEISISDLNTLDTSIEGVIIFSKERGGLNNTITNLFKEMHVRRIYNKDTETILYITYTTKAFEGHYKNSISAISPGQK